MEHQQETQARTPEASVTHSSTQDTQLRSRAALHPVLRLQQRIGNRAVQRVVANRGTTLQAKLIVSGAHDPYEQEAERVAQQVVRMATPPSGVAKQTSAQRQAPEKDEVTQTKPLAGTITPLVQRAPSDPLPCRGGFLQRKCACGGTPGADGACEECRDMNSFEPGADFETRLSTVGDGSPLAADTRAFMEPRFGADFSGVRLHKGSEVAQLNRAVSAKAFTHGKDIYLGEGMNNLESSAGKQLLAHELTHVLQQDGGFSRPEIQRDLLAHAPGTPVPALQRQVHPAVPTQAPAQDIRSRVAALVQSPHRMEVIRLMDAPGFEPAEGTPCPKCEDEENIPAKGMSGHTLQMATALGAQIASCREGGQPLSASVRGPISIIDGGPAQVQRVAAYDTVEQTKLIEEGIRDKDIGKIKEVEPIAYALANDGQAIDMILILLNQGWVGPRDEVAIYGIWKSRGKGIVDLASKFLFVWNMCLSRGVDTIWTIPDLEPVKTEFKKAVAARARGYLDTNKKEVDSERKRYGLDNMGAAPSPETGREREKMLQAAGVVKKAKDAIEKMDRMLVGYNHVVGTPQDNKVEHCAALFNPGAPPPLPGHVPVPAPEGAVLPSWDDTRKNYERAHAVIDHYTRLYPALVALREDTDLNTVARTGISSEEPPEKLTAMKVVSNALNETMSNIDKTYPLVDDPKGEFALELQPIHERLFLFDPTWKDPFRQMIARAAVKEHNNVEFWNTVGVSAAGLALFVVAELATGGLATYFFAAAAAGGIAQAAASWDKYLTLKAAGGTNLTEETSLISRDQVSDQLLTAVIDTLMAFVDAYTAAKGGAKALTELGEAETKLGGIAGKEARAAEAESKLRRVDVGNGHDVRATDRGIERCSDQCPLIGNFWEAELERHPDIKPRLEQDAQLARTDPVWASRDAAAADRALQNLNEQDLAQWAADIPALGVPETPKFSTLKRLPPQRAEIANRALTPEEMKFVEKNIADAKAEGRLPADFEYAPPSIPGAVIPRDLAQNAMQVIGKRISENPAVAACWETAVEDLRKLLSPENYDALYKKAASRFWSNVGREGAAKDYFTKFGYKVDGKTAAYLDVKGVDRQEVSLGLDHTFPKATDDNWKYALDGDKLQFLMQADNTKLSHLEKKDPTLRR